MEKEQIQRQTAIPSKNVHMQGDFHEAHCIVSIALILELDECECRSATRRLDADIANATILRTQRCYRKQHHCDSYYEDTWCHGLMSAASTNIILADEGQLNMTSLPQDKSASCKSSCKSSRSRPCPCVLPIPFDPHPYPYILAAMRHPRGSSSASPRATPECV